MRHSRSMRSIVLTLALMTLGGCQTARDSGAGESEPGPLSAGFRSFWTTDPARTYRTTFDKGQTYGSAKQARPVLVNVWYPASASGNCMSHAEYLRIPSADPALQPLAQRLAAYQREVLVSELLAGDKSAQAGEYLDRILHRPTSVVRDARAASGRFPLVIYHAGAGSSFEDNTALCESLARDGFVVLGGAFQAADGSSFNVDVENAGREFEFLLRLAAGMENVDLSHVALVGHSAGAQAALIYGARPGIAIDAMVALDTTQDYRTVADPRWSLLVPALTRGQTVYRTPTLFVAGPSAIFALADTLAGAERVYLTIPGLSHNEYISQGETTAAIAADRKPDPTGALARHAQEIAQTGQRLRTIIAAYLRAKLKNDPQAWRDIERLYANPIGTDMHADLTPAGATGPTEQPGSPTPRSVYQALRKSGADGAIAELRRGEALDPALFDSGFAFALLYELAVSDRPDETTRLFEFFRARGIDVRPSLIAQTDFFASLNRYPEFVEGCVRIGRAVAAGDPATEQMVAKYGKPQETPRQPR